MPRVQQYETRVQPGRLRAPLQTQPINVTKGLTQLTVQYLENKEREKKALQAEEGLQEFIKSSNGLLLTGDNPYYGTQGKESMDRRDETVESLEKIKKGILSKQTPDVSRILGKSIDSRINTEGRRIYQRALQGQEEYKIAIGTSGIKVATENILLNYKDPKKIQASMIVIGENLKDTMPGAPAEERMIKRDNIISSALTGAIDRALTAGDLTTAKSLRDTYDKNLKANDKTKIDKQIKGNVRLGKAQQNTDRIYDPNLTLVQMKTKANKIKDPDEKRLTKQLIESRWSDKQQSENVTRSDTYNSMALELDDFESSQDKAMRLAGMATRPGWELLTENQRASLRQKAVGAGTKTNILVFSELNRLFHTGDKASFADYLNNNADKLSVSDYKAFDKLLYKVPKDDQIHSYTTKKQRRESKLNGLDLTEEQIVMFETEIDKWYSEFQEVNKRKPKPQEIDDQLDYLLSNTGDITNPFLSYIPFVEERFKKTFEAEGEEREQLNKMERLRAAFEKRYNREPTPEEMTSLVGLMNE